VLFLSRNVSGKRTAQASELRTRAKTTSHPPSIPMSQQPNLKLLPCKDRIILTIQAIKSNALLSQQRAAIIYNVSKSTLQTQRAKTTSQRNSHPNSSKLQRHKEETIVQYIRKLNARGFAPTLSYVQEIANQLLAACGGS
jgi:hypothetical protein